MKAKRRTLRAWQPRINTPYVVRDSAALHAEVQVQPEKRGLQGTITNP
jgi:hypothetical protein